LKDLQPFQKKEFHELEMPRHLKTKDDLVETTMSQGPEEQDEPGAGG